jgi:hypothetical protein
MNIVQITAKCPSPDRPINKFLTPPLPNDAAETY